jgi:hypothetical protein
MNEETKQPEVQAFDFDLRNEQRGGKVFSKKGLNVASTMKAADVWTVPPCPDSSVERADT